MTIFQSPDKRQKSVISGCRLHWIISTLFPRFSMSLVRRSPQNEEKVGQRKMRNFLPRLWLTYFLSVPDFQSWPLMATSNLRITITLKGYLAACFKGCFLNNFKNLQKIYKHTRLNSGKKKQHKHKLFGPDFPRTFLTLTPGCPGVKKFLPTTGAAGKHTFWCGRPRLSARTSMTRRVIEKLCPEKVCLIFWFLKLASTDDAPLP